MNGFHPIRCEFLVLQFETKKYHNIVGVSTSADGFRYATFGTGREILHMVPSDFAREMWIDAVIDFLENRIVFSMPNQPNADTSTLELSSNMDVDVDGIPDEIIGNFSEFFLWRSVHQN